MHGQQNWPTTKPHSYSRNCPFRYSSDIGNTCLGIWPNSHSFSALYDVSQKANTAPLTRHSMFVLHRFKESFSLLSWFTSPYSNSIFSLITCLAKSYIAAHGLAASGGCCVSSIWNSYHDLSLLLPSTIFK